MLKELLAKQWRGDDSPPVGVTLRGHLQVAEKAGQFLCERFGEKVLKTAGLAGSEWLSRLTTAVRVSARFHDIGKANAAFQRMVRGYSAYQPIRHELISGLSVLPDKPLHEAFIRDLNVKSIDEPLALTALGAIVGHHGKLDNRWSTAAPVLREGGYGDISLSVEFHHPDVHALFGTVRPWRIGFLEGEEDYLGILEGVFRRLNRTWCRFLNANRDWQVFAGIAKVLVSAVDVVASALPDEEQVVSWIDGALSKVVAYESLAELVETRLQGRQLREFQRAVGSSRGRVTLVEAGCGSGKTVAAYEWAKNHAVDHKLFFCYPTTGTATEGFFNYVVDSPIEGALVHSRALVDTELLSNGEEGKDDDLLRIDSLDTWIGAITVCTVDTVLSLIRNGRKGRYASPALLTGRYVFDEIHSYDGRIFDAMLSLIETLQGASFLLMSASLTPRRRKLLEERFPELEVITTPEELERLPRYEFLDGTDNPWNFIEKSLEAGVKVLWTVNTVSRAQNLFDLAREKGLPCTVYHSRFKYLDRLDRHRQVMALFAGSTGHLIVTTQVAEMSLDIDADVLVSDIAPIPALIQRLGRLNRRITPDSPGAPRPAVFFMPETPAPYKEEQLTLAQDWVRKLRDQGRPISQRDLSTTFAAFDDLMDEVFDMKCEWLSQGMISVPGPVREAGYSVFVLMEEDLPSCHSCPAEAIRRSIPLSYSQCMDKWASWRRYLVAPAGSIRYSAERGAQLV